MSNPPFDRANLPVFSSIDPATIFPRIKSLLDEDRKKIAALLSETYPFTWDNLMRPLEELNDELNKTWSPIAHLHSVKETDELREAYNKTLPLLTEYHTELSQNEKLFKAISSIEKSDSFNQLSPAQKKIIENDIRDFKLAGVHLAPKEKNRLAELQKELSQLMTTFSENVLDATQGWTIHITDRDQLEGLPESALQLAIDNAKNRNLEGYVLTLDYPSYSTAIKFLRNRQLREKLYEAYATRASDSGPHAGKWDNTKIIENILKVRHEIASLVGYQQYAEFSLVTKMAKNTETVLEFLQDLVKRSKPMAMAEYEEVKALAKKLDNITDLKVWDIPYYSEKLQKTKFAFNDEDIRPYFPIEKVLNGMFNIVHQLYGINIIPEKNIDVWHEDIQFFSIVDAQGECRGGFYIDLYARPHKKDGAWMDDCLARRKLEKGLQHPVAFLTCNFMPPVGEQTALLTHDDVLTLFHEFGHCLHHMLTKVDYPSVAGINGVPWDAVEFPSQFMEYFCWEKESLKLISEHYQTKASIPDELYKKMLAAKHFQTGLQMIRQLEFALFDFRLHLEFDEAKKNQTQTILDEVRKNTSVIPVPEWNRFQNSFSHIFGGAYAAGYYSYKWAEVLSADAYGKFEENNIFDRETGQSFLHNILEVGGVRDPLTSFVAFRGRQPTIDALLRQSGIRE